MSVAFCLPFVCMGDHGATAVLLDACTPATEWHHSPAGPLSHTAVPRQAEPAAGWQAVRLTTDHLQDHCTSQAHSPQAMRGGGMLQGHSRVGDTSIQSGGWHRLASVAVQESDPGSCTHGASGQ